MNGTVHSFSHINRRVRNMDETIDFYTRHLGFYLLRRFLRSERESAYIGLGDVLFELFVAQDPSELPRADEGRLGLTVTGLDALVERLRAAGIEVVEEPAVMTTFWGRQASIRDPNGYQIALREWEAPDGPHYADWQPRHDFVKRLD